MYTTPEILASLKKVEETRQQRFENKDNIRRMTGEEKEEILGIPLTKMTIPVSPGRNIAVIVETAASVYRLSQMGYNAMDELAERMKNQ